MIQTAVRRRCVGGARSDDSGFTLVEVIVALALILIIMTASVTFLVRSLQSTAAQQTRQAAVAIANQAMEFTRAIPAAGLAANRYKPTADTQWANLPAAAATAKSLSNELYDVNATAASVADVPFSTSGATTYVNKTQFTVNTAIGQCWVATTSAAQCKIPNPGGAATAMYRVIVDVHWAAKQSETCPASGCDYLVTTLRDPSVDPLFNSNNPS